MKTRKNNTIIKNSTDANETIEVQNSLNPGEKEDANSSPVVKPRKPGKRPEYLSLVNQIGLIRRSIESSLSDRDIMKYIAKYGYNEAEFQAGMNMVNQVEALYVRQGDLLIDQKAATRKKNELGHEAEKMLSRFVKAARLAFENDPETLIKFRSPGQFNQNFSAWLINAKIFFEYAFSSPEILREFEKYQVTRQDLESAKQKLIEVETQSKIQFGVIADCQVATDEVNRAYSRLIKWWSQYRKISRIAFQNDPQLMEKLGIVVPTRKVTKTI